MAKSKEQLDETDNMLEVTVTEEIKENQVHCHCGDKAGDRTLSLTEKIRESFVKIVIIDTDDFGDEDNNKPDQYRLGEIWHDIQPLSSIYKIKQNLAQELSLVNIATGSLNDLNLGCMNQSIEDGAFTVSRDNESEKSIHKILEKSTPSFYLAFLLVRYVCEHTTNSAIKKLLDNQNEYLENVCSVLKNALIVNGWIVPDLLRTREKFDEFKAGLPSLIDDYLKSKSQFSNLCSEGSGCELLRQHKQLVINYEIVSEVELAMSYLREVFEEIKADVLGDGNSGTSNVSTIWTMNERSEVTHYYA